MGEDYIITYNNYQTGGTGTTTETVRNGESTIPPLSETWTGHTFNGWFTAETGGTQVLNRLATTYTPTANITLYAQWIADYTVYLFGQNGNPADDTVVIVSAYTSIELPTLSWTENDVVHTFVGWFNAPTSGTQQPNPFTPTENTNLYAQWSIVVTFNSQFVGIDPTYVNRNNGQAIGTLPSPTRPGYSLVGWFALKGEPITASTLISRTNGYSQTFFARWSLNYEITYYDGQGNIWFTQYVAAGSPISTFPPTPTRDGYSFKGWFDGPVGGTQITTAYVPLGDTSIYAQWTVLMYHIIFNYQTPGVPNTSQDVIQGSVIDPLPDGGLNGHFLPQGWFDAPSGGNSVVAPYKPIADATLYFQWVAPQYKLTLDANIEGGTPAVQYIFNEEGVTVDLTTAYPVSRPGYGFLGWATGASPPYIILTTFTFSPATDGTYLFGTWTANPIPHIVTFAYQDGVTPNVTVSIPYGSNISPYPPDQLDWPFPLAGYTARGWLDKPVPPGNSITSAYVPTSNVTVYGQWTVSVTYNFNNGTGHTQTDTVPATTASTFPTVTYPGYTFYWWYDIANDIGYTGASFVPSASVTLDAQWTKNPLAVNYNVLDPYTLTFNTLGTDYADPLGNVVLATFEATGFTFDAWFLNTSFGTLAGRPGSTYAVPYPITDLYGHYFEILYTVSFDNNGFGGTTPPPQLGGILTAVALPTLTQFGYNFNGWADIDSNLIASPYYPTSNITLYAQWGLITLFTKFINEDVAGTPEYTIAWDVSTYPTGFLLPTISEDNYTFQGWFTDVPPDGTKIGDGGTRYIPSSNGTLYGGWNVIQYTVDYFYLDVNGGRSQVTVDYGTVIELPILRWNVYHNFNGWADNTDTFIGAGGTPYTVLSNISMYGQWTIVTNIVSLTYDSQNGSIAWPVLAGMGSNIQTLAPAPIRPNYIFTGWYDAPSGGNLISPPFFLYDYVSLYAQWAEIPQPLPQLDIAVAVRTCPPNRTSSIRFLRTRLNQRCCPSPQYSMTFPTVNLSGNVQFQSSYPMNEKDVYMFTMTNNQPGALKTTYTKYYKNSANGYDTGVLDSSNVPFYITVVPYQDLIPRASYTIPFTSLTPQAPLLVTPTQNGPNSIFLQWLVPESDQYVSTITSYIVQYGISSQIATSNSIRISGLLPQSDISYTFTVQASNMAGLGTISLPSETVGIT